MASAGKRTVVVLGFVLGFVLLLLAVTAYGRSRAGATAVVAHAEAPEAADPGTISLSPEARANIGLLVVSAQERIIERSLLLNATFQVDPDEEAFVSSRVQGKVTEVGANVGDVVRRGQSLVTLQSLQIAETPPMVEVASPLDGVVLDRTVTVGETVESSKSLLRVANLSHVLAQAEVYEADLAHVRLGQLARLRAAPYPGLVLTGRVSRISYAIDPTRRTLRIWIEVKNTPDRKLKPEMFAQVNLVVASSGRMVAVPNEAVQTDGPERFVFVQNGSAFVRQNVVTGEQDDQFTAITRGVLAGDLVVTRGATELKTVSLQPAAGGVQDESKPHTH